MLHRFQAFVVVLVTSFTACVWLDLMTGGMPLQTVPWMGGMALIIATLFIVTIGGPRQRG